MLSLLKSMTGFFLFCFASAQANSHQEITDRLKTHVSFLASDALEGRLTGSPGEKLATQYIANIFLSLGLEPAGDHETFFQEFEVNAGFLAGRNNTLSITNQKGETQHLILNRDWRPLAFSDNLIFRNRELVFAGYGITAPARGKLPPYNSWKGLNADNKWVIVLRDLPDHLSKARRHQLRPYSSLRYKAFAAKAHGAKGIIFVNGPGSIDKETLIPLSADNSLTGAGIGALSLRSSALPGLPDVRGLRVSGQTDVRKNIRHARNVLARLRLRRHAKGIILIGAHADHLGRGEHGGSRARSNESGMIHPGADDNASGVASVLEAAGRLSEWVAAGKLQGNKDILFAAWSGEESGILGSSHFVKKVMKTLEIDAAINLDMVGNLREKLVLQGTGSSADWEGIIMTVKAKHPIPIITQSDPYLPTDSTAFYLQGVPTLNFFTGAHDNYHTPRDKPDTLNYTGMKNIGELLVSLVATLEDRPDPMTWQQVKKPGIKARGRRIYLGTIPDYANAESGVMLSGVAKNSPAERAGIREGDVIIELAGKNIHNIYEYTFVLNTLHVGEPTSMTVLRQQKKVVLKINPE